MVQNGSNILPVSRPVLFGCFYFANLSNLIFPSQKAGLRSLYLGKVKESKSAVVEQVQLGVNFDKLESEEVYVESKNPTLIVKPYQSVAQMHESPTSTTLISKNLIELPCTRLSAIQKYVLANILDGTADVLVSAPTGCGKTFSYIAGICQIVVHLRRPPSLLPNRPPIALILAPTRELVLQIAQQISCLLQNTGVRSLYLYGQINLQSQIQGVKEGVDIIVSTPGRLVHLIKEKILRLGELRYFIVDEFDHVLFPNAEGGHTTSYLVLASDFNQTTLKMMATLFGNSADQSKEKPSEYRLHVGCRYFFFSAAIDGRIRLEAEKYLDPNYVLMIMGDTFKTVSADIQQLIVPVRNYTDKKIQLVKLLKKLYSAYERILVFVSERIMADTLADYLNANGFFAVSTHGQRTQQHREKVFGDFIAGKMRLLVSTRLLARGINVTDLNCIINFDFPENLSEYIHSIGRTGRLGAVGLAISFFNTTLKQDLALLPDLLAILRDSSQNVPQFLLDIQNKLH